MVELGLLDLKERAYQVIHYFMRICLIDLHDRMTAYPKGAHRREYSIRGVLSVFCDLFGRPQSSN